MMRRVLPLLAMGIVLITSACLPAGQPAPGCPSGTLTVMSVNVHWQHEFSDYYSAQVQVTVGNGATNSVSNSSGYVDIRAFTAPSGPNGRTEWNVTAFANGGLDLLPGQSAIWEGTGEYGVQSSSRPPDVLAYTWQVTDSIVFWGGGYRPDYKCGNYSGPPVV